MKITLSFLVICLFFINSIAQSKTISKAEYDNVFQFAVRETNADYPLILKVVTTSFKNGKIISTESEVNENESAGHYRIKRTTLANGREINNYQITFGFGNVFCSSDAINWKPSKYECGDSRMIYAPRIPESIEYSVTEKTVDGKKVKVYREYSIFPPSENNQTKDFKEKTATIDSRGFFITVVNTEGTINPKTITLKSEQSWITKAKIKTVVAPKIN